MKVRFQSSLLLLATLVIGMILGALLHSALLNQRINRAYMLRNEENFIQAVQSAIIPASDEQAARIQAILEETAPRLIEQIRENRKQLRVELNRLRRELKPLLDEEQLIRLETRLYGAPRKQKSPKEQTRETQSP